jgi:hypothetical protein
MGRKINFGKNVFLKNDQHPLFPMVKNNNKGRGKNEI